MKTSLSVGLLLTVSLMSPAAFPCGAPFGTGISIDPTQDIVLVHKNGVETYVFQPRFCGTASEFGLILPVPSPLSSAPALSKTSVFTHVDSLSRPEYRNQTVCRTKGTDSAGAPDAGSRNGGGAIVVSSGTVGFMDYTQLKADTSASFTDWLDTNGYPYDTLAKEAFSYYVDKGWYFLAFKISQGTVPAGTTVCKDLGPVKFSFPSEAPVVPTRMATARNRETSSTLGYASSFTWRIFGITAGPEQLAFVGGSATGRTLGYSGLLDAGDKTPLDGLAEPGDRLARLNLTFGYGSKNPDVELTNAPGTDYREVITTYSYTDCPDPPDASPTKADTATAKQDAGVAPDAEVVKPAQTDASLPITTPATDKSSGNDSGSGCSMGAGAEGPGLASLFALALVLGVRWRRRNRRG